MTVTSCSTFAQRFCPTRWVANESVAELAIKLWDGHIKVVNHYLSLCKSKRPQDNTSFDCLVANRSDSLMKAKMQFFKDISHQLNTFLTPFQTDAPMVPFLPIVLSDLIRKLMSYFVIGDVLDKAATPHSLIKLNVSLEGGNCKNINNLKLPTATKSLLRKLNPKAEFKTKFLKESKSFLIGTVQKLQERSPLKYSLVRHAASFNPYTMANDQQSASVMFGGLVEVMYEHERLTSSEGDDAKTEYANFLRTVVASNKMSFTDFDFNLQRLDEFMIVYLAGNVKFKLLFKVFQFVCVLSHGQGSIERGFNINKDILIENLKKA